MGRLFHQDRLIARNTLRATFAGWHDRAIAALLLVFALAVVRAWFVDRPWTMAVAAALAACVVVGAMAERLITTRLAFHAADGILAADALSPRAAREYGLAWHGIALALLVAVTLIVRLPLLVVGVPAYLAGVLVARLTRSGVPRRIAGTVRPGWAIRTWSHRPVAGPAAAVVLLLLLLPFRTVGTSALPAPAAVATVALTLMLTDVDAAVVHFMTVSGHGSRAVVVHPAKGLASFFVVGTAGGGAVYGPGAGGVVAAGSATVLLLLILRVLAYRLHAKRFADLLVSALVGLLVVVVASVPVALPIVVIAMLWRLHRRGEAKRWLLA